MNLRDKVPMEKWVAMMERVLLKDPDWRNAPYVWEEKPENVYRYVSFSPACVNRIMSVKEYIEWLVNGARRIMERLYKGV
jgi:hypothetical protein